MHVCTWCSSQLVSARLSSCFSPLIAHPSLSPPAGSRAIVMRYSKEWEQTVTRIGRWISFENDYKTMHLSFMESVWWVFGQLHAKGLVYRGFKVMPYSCACNTPLSNFEVQQNYKTVDDPAVVCAFPAGGMQQLQQCGKPLRKQSTNSSANTNGTGKRSSESNKNLSRRAGRAAQRT